MKFLLALLALCGAAFSQPVVTFTKSFPGSMPAYVSIEVKSDGSAVYKEAVDDEEPVSFKVAENDVKMIFGLAETLDKFQKPLESGLKVAFMGKKTFLWKNGAEQHETTFNFSLDENAKTLLDWFERVSETQQLWFALERTVKFDRLGVNKSILQLEAAFDRGRIVSPERFLPLLDRVAKNDAYLHMARERAASLADVFRNPKPKTGE